MIRSQSFGDPVPLDCEFISAACYTHTHTHTPLGGIGWLEGAGVCFLLVS